MAQFKDMAYDSFNEALPTGKHPIYTEIAQSFLQQYIIALPKCALFDMRNYVKCKFYVIEGRGSEK